LRSQQADLPAEQVGFHNCGSASLSSRGNFRRGNSYTDPLAEPLYIFRHMDEAMGVVGDEMIAVEFWRITDELMQHTSAGSFVFEASF